MRDVVILRDVVIDKTGGTHMLWCGPCLVSAFTGAPLSAVEEAFRKIGCGDFGATTRNDVAAAFSLFGFGMRGVYAFSPNWEPPLWRFLRMARRPSPQRVEAGDHHLDPRWLALGGDVRGGLAADLRLP
jgi:hypothetical protein